MIARNASSYLILKTFENDLHKLFRVMPLFFPRLELRAEKSDESEDSGGC